MIASFLFIMLSYMRYCHQRSRAEIRTNNRRATYKHRELSERTRRRTSKVMKFFGIAHLLVLCLASTFALDSEEKLGTTKEGTALPSNVPEIKSAHELLVEASTEQPILSVSTTDVTENPLDAEDLVNITSTKTTEVSSTDAVESTAAADEFKGLDKISTTQSSILTSAVTEGTLPAEITAADPFATSFTSSASSVISSVKNSSETVVEAIGTTTDMSQSSSQIITSTIFESAHSTESSLIVDEMSSTTAQATSSISAAEANRFINEEQVASKTTETGQLGSSLFTTLLTSETTQHVESSTIAEEEESLNQDGDITDDSFFVADKSLFNAEANPFSELTISSSVSSQLPSYIETTLPSNTEPNDFTHAETSSAQAEEMDSDVTTSLSLDRSSTISPPILSKEPLPINFDGSNTSSNTEKEEMQENSNDQSEEKLGKENEWAEIDTKIDPQNENERHESATEERIVNSDNDGEDHNNDQETTTEPTSKPVQEINHVEELNEEDEGSEATVEPNAAVAPHQEPPSIPEPEPKPEPTTGPYKTPYSLRITNIDYTPEFENPNSGKSRKLRDQLIPELEEIFSGMFTSSYRGVSIETIRKGSVVIDGNVYTSTRPSDDNQLATEFEQRISAREAQIGGNDVDVRSVSLNGFVSKNYVERVHEGYTSSSSSSYVVGGGIAVGVIAILLVAFAVIAMNNRRSNGTLKLKEENIAMTENGRGPWNNTSPVNLMGYGNGHHQIHPQHNGQSSMVTTLTVNDENGGR